jgi:tight adherence protein C
MVLLFAMGVALLALGAVLFARAIALSRLRTETQLRQIDTYGFAPGDGSAANSAERSAPLTERLAAMAEAIGRATAGRGWRAPVDAASLRAAGLYGKVTVETFHGYRVMAAIGLPSLILLLSLSGGSFGAMNFLLVVLTAVLCWFAPALLVKSRAQRRMNEIDRALPELVDVLIATIEAGLGFAGSLQLVADRFGGALGQELRLTLHEQSMGLSSERALSNLVARADTPSMRAFVRAVLQGEALGVSVATTMRNLATETRKRRRQNAHAEIQKAPVKMLFPLVFLIFPALLIVLLYPAVTRLIEQLGGS